MPAPVVDERTGHFTSRAAAGLSLLALALLLALLVLLFSPLFA